MAARRVTQETFDAAVKENVEEFEMSPQEAVADAVEQFKQQGVDLSNVVTTGDRSAAADEVHPVVETARALHAVVDTAATDPAAVTPHLEKLISLCAGNAGHRDVAGEAAAVEASVKAVEAWSAEAAHWPALPMAFDAVRCLCTKHDANRSRLTAGFFTAVLNTVHTPKAGEVEVRVHRAALAAAATACVKREKHKLTLMKGDFPNVVATTLTAHGSDPAVLKEALAVVRVLTSDDDRDAVMSKAFTSAREFVGVGVVPQLFELCRTYHDNPAAVTDIFTVLTKLACDETICQDMAADGGLELVVATTAAHIADVSVAKAGMALLRALARSDKLKKLFCEAPAAGSGSDRTAMRLMLEVLAVHVDKAAVLDQALGAIASTCLRHPEHAASFVAAGVLPFVAQSMRKHGAHVGVQRQACQVVRNVVSRSPDLRPKVLEEGFEALVRATRAAHPRAEDVAYAALRDMGVDDFASTDEAVVPGATAGAGAGSGKSA